MSDRFVDMRGLMPQREFEEAVKQKHDDFDGDTALELYEKVRGLLEIIGNFVEYICLANYFERLIVLVIAVGGMELERPLLFYKSTGKCADMKLNDDLAIEVWRGELTAEEAKQKALATSLAGFWIPTEGCLPGWLRKSDIEMAQQELTPKGQQLLLKFSRLVSDSHAAVSAWLYANPPDERLFPEPTSPKNIENLKLLFEKDLNKEKFSLLITEHLAAQRSAHAAKVLLETPADGIESEPLVW